MTLNVESDAAYLFMPVACSCIYGNYCLSDHPTNPTNPSYVNPNGPILTKFKTLLHVVRSKSEAETRGLFINVQKIVPIFTYWI